MITWPENRSHFCISHLEVSNCVFPPDLNLFYFTASIWPHFIKQPSFLIESSTHTDPETNIAPENGWLEYYIVSFWVSAYFQGRTLSFREGIYRYIYIDILYIYIYIYNIYIYTIIHLYPQHLTNRGAKFKGRIWPWTRPWFLWAPVPWSWTPCPRWLLAAGQKWSLGCKENGM